MTVLEQRFMETTPQLLRDLIKEIQSVKKELGEIREELKNRDSNQEN